jgi:ABC-type transport system involved in cytochrome bd biosynthesis fused ATPase/permease subunit
MDTKKRTKNELNQNRFEHFLNFLLRLVAQSVIVVVIFYRLIYKSIPADLYFLILIGIIVVLALMDKISYLNIPGLVEIKKLSGEIQDVYKKIVTKVNQTQAQQQITNNNNYFGTTTSPSTESVETEIPPETSVRPVIGENIAGDTNK